MSAVYLAALAALWGATIITLVALLIKWRRGLSSPAGKPEVKIEQRKILATAGKIREKADPKLKESLGRLASVAVSDEKAVKALVKKWLSEKEGDKLQR
ncbi:MAG: hypothetical protein HZB29_08150 [Nitrospinae bacterium]|nr:hypothetical protein [Nitrospinota bacterium]